MFDSSMFESNVTTVQKRLFRKRSQHFNHDEYSKRFYSLLSFLSPHSVPFFQVLICAQVFYCFELHCICSWFAVCLLFVCCLFVVGLLFVCCLLLLCDISKSFRVGAEYSGISEAVSLYIYNVAHRVVAEQFITFHQEERLAATV